MNKELRATLHSMHRTSVNQFDMDLAARRIMENECAPSTHFTPVLAILGRSFSQMNHSLDSIQSKVSGLLRASVSTVKYNC